MPTFSQSFTPFPLLLLLPNSLTVSRRGDVKLTKVANRVQLLPAAAQVPGGDRDIVPMPMKRRPGEPTKLSRWVERGKVKSVTRLLCHNHPLPYGNWLKKIDFSEKKRWHTCKKNQVWRSRG